MAKGWSGKMQGQSLALSPGTSSHLRPTGSWQSYRDHKIISEVTTKMGGPQQDPHRADTAVISNVPIETGGKAADLHDESPLLCHDSAEVFPVLFIPSMLKV